MTDEAKRNAFESAQALSDLLNPSEKRGASEWLLEGMGKKELGKVKTG